MFVNIPFAILLHLWQHMCVHLSENMTMWNNVPSFAAEENGRVDLLNNGAEANVLLDMSGGRITHILYYKCWTLDKPMASFSTCNLDLCLGWQSC